MIEIERGFQELEYLLLNVLFSFLFSFLSKAQAIGVGHAHSSVALYSSTNPLATRHFGELKMHKCGYKIPLNGLG